MKRTSMLIFALVLAGCADRQTSADDDEPIERVSCMVLPAYGHYADGSQLYMTNEWDRTGTVCMCMTRDDLVNRIYDDELNELGYEECMRISEMYDFEWTDCETLHEDGTWLGSTSVAIEDDAWMNQLGLVCGDEDEALGCVVEPGKGSRRPWALMLLAWVLVLRRVRR